VADQTQEAIDARYEVNKALKALIYGPHYNYVTAEVQNALVAALEALEESEDTPTEEEHAHQEAPHAQCIRCGRDVPRRFLARLIERQGGGLACSPLDPENQAECQRIVEAREERL